MASSNNFGGKVSQRGYDVRTAADDQLLFNSKWPNLKVVYYGRVTKVVTVNPGDTYITVLEHNLGYYPAFVLYTNDDDTSGTSFFTLGRYNLFMGKNQAIVEVPGVVSPTVFTFDFYIYIFALDLEANLSPGSIKTTPAPTGESNEDIGIKVTKEGADVTSTDLRDYAIHSGTRSPMVHIVKNGYATDDSYSYPGYVRSFRVTHGLPYNPMFMAYFAPFFSFVDYGYDEVMYQSITSTAASNSAEGQVIIDSISALNKCTIVVLKDPFEVT